MTVAICSVSHPAVRSDGGIHYVKLPQASSASFVLRFMETLCHQLQSDNLFSSQPFSPAFMASTGHTAYDRSTSGNACKPWRVCVCELFLIFVTKPQASMYFPSTYTINSRIRNCGYFSNIPLVIYNVIAFSSTGH